MFGRASPGNSREEVLGYVGDGDSSHDQFTAVREKSQFWRKKGYVCVAMKRNEFQMLKNLQFKSSWSIL